MGLSSFFMFIIMSFLLYFSLRTLKVLKLNFFKFAIGSLGIFTLAMIFFMDPLNDLLSQLITKIMTFFANTLGAFEVYAENTMLLIDAKDGMISMLINYECSGVIEMLVYTSLVAFFPFISLGRKIFDIVWGNLYIVGCNIVRMLVIIFFVKSQGIDAYNIAHTIVGRIVFFVMIIFLYYRVFTKSQLVNQKVGDIK